MTEDLSPDGLVQMSLRNHPRATGLAPLVPSNTVVEALRAFIPLFAKDVQGHVKKFVDAVPYAKALLDELEGLGERTADRLHGLLEKHKAELAKADADGEAVSKKREAAHNDREKGLQQREQAVAAREAAVKAAEERHKRRIEAFNSAA